MGRHHAALVEQAAEIQDVPHQAQEAASAAAASGAAAPNAPHPGRGHLLDGLEEILPPVVHLAREARQGLVPALAHQAGGGLAVGSHLLKFILGHAGHLPEAALPLLGKAVPALFEAAHLIGPDCQALLAILLAEVQHLFLQGAEVRQFLLERAATRGLCWSCCPRFPVKRRCTRPSSSHSSRVKSLASKG